MPDRDVLGVALAAAEPITRDGAREDAVRELLRQEYQAGRPSLLDRALDRLLQELTELLDGLIRVVPGGGGSLVLLVVLAVVALVLVRLGLVPLLRSRRGGLDDERDTARERTAEDYRREADEHAAHGRWDEALRARLRAVVRDLERRGVLDPRPGRTADDVARAASRALPDCAQELHALASAFDEVWYGGRAATSADDALGRSVDARVRAARPVVPVA